jgi:two-component system, OmpR family, response regulator
LEAELSGVILIAEDDDLLRTYVARGLSEEGLLVCEAADGQTALDLAQSRAFDLYVLDRNLPGMDGVSLLRSLRTDGDQTPALFLTTLGEIGDRVRGLDAGADDYMVKPFAIAELMARVRALLRRPVQLTPESLVAGPLRLDLTGRRAFVRDVEVDLTAQDIALLSVFLRHPRRAFTREALLDQLNADDDITPAAIEHAVSRLRKKLAQADAPDLIETVRGVGYRLTGLPNDAAR